LTKLWSWVFGLLFFGPPCTMWAVRVTERMTRSRWNQSVTQYS